MPNSIWVRSCRPYPIAHNTVPRFLQKAKPKLIKVKRAPYVPGSGTN
jgi:hypothetical protein